MKYKCPCCGFLTLTSPSPGSYEVCPVCHWEDDVGQYDDPDDVFGANRVSLREARANFQKYGVCSAEGRGLVRAPLADEIPTEESENSQ